MLPLLRFFAPLKDRKACAR